MEFRIAKNEFLRGLRLAQGIADRKSTMPMLANVLLRTQGKNQILVAATDLNVSLTAELKSTNTGEGGLTLERTTTKHGRATAFECEAGVVQHTPKKRKPRRSGVVNLCG